MRLLALLVCASVGCLPQVALAQVAAVDTQQEWPVSPDPDRIGEEPAGADVREPIGLSVDLGVASAYAFRGLNLLQAGSQHDQRFVLQPWVAYAVPDSGLTVGYFGSYQVSGDNRQALVDAGVGDEQDLMVTYSKEVHELVTIGTGVAAYLYPFASEKVAGSAAPLYLEPSVAVALSYEVDISLTTSLMAGMQDALRPSTYVYVSPRVSKTLAIVDGISVTGSLGYGGKLQQSPENVHDVSLDVGALFEPAEFFYIKPAVHWAWTNLEAAAFVDEQFGWVSTNVGTNL